MRTPPRGPNSCIQVQACSGTAFKSKLVRGHYPPTEDDPAWCHQQNLGIQGRSFAVVRAEGNSWSPFKKLCFDEPQDHPSTLGLWAKQGGEKFEHLTSRLDDMGRFKELFQSLDRLLPQAIFHAKLNPMAAEPLSMLPKKPERVF